MKYVGVSIADNHVQETLRLLGTLKCRKVESVKIWIEAKEHTEGPLATIGVKKAELVPKWAYKIDEIEISSEHGNCSAVIPNWLMSIQVMRRIISIPQRYYNSIITLEKK